MILLTQYSENVSTEKIEENTCIVKEFINEMTKAISQEQDIINLTKPIEEQINLYIIAKEAYERAVKRVNSHDYTETRRKPSTTSKYTHQNTEQTRNKGR